MRWSLRPARREDVAFIGRNMREIDQRECVAMGARPLPMIERCLASSTWCLVALYDDEPVAAIGVIATNAVAGVGAPWMLCTDKAAKGVRGVAVLGPRIVEAMHDDWPVLENWVGAENGTAIRLIEYLGFTVDGETVVIGGLEMRRFRKVANVR